MGKQELIRCLDEALQMAKTMPENVAVDTDEKVNFDVINQVRTIAKKNAFDDHMLTKYGEAARECYITALMILTESTQDQIALRAQMTFIGRILASVDRDVDLQKYVLKKMKADRNFGVDFPTFVCEELSISFAVDAFVLINLAGAERDRSLVAATSLIEILGIDRNNIMNAARIAKAILKQKFYDFLDSMDNIYDLDCNKFLCYFEEGRGSYICSKVEDGFRRTGKVIYRSLKFKYKEIHPSFYLLRGDNKYFSLDNMMANEILFYNCDLSQYHGLTFDNNMKLKVKVVKTNFFYDELRLVPRGRGTDMKTAKMEYYYFREDEGIEFNCFNFKDVDRYKL